MMPLCAADEAIEKHIKSVSWVDASGKRKELAVVSVINDLKDGL